MLPVLARAIFLLAAFLQQSPARTAVQTEFRITGTVVNALDGQAISRAEVRILLDRSDDEGRAVISSGSGGFEFNHVPPGKYVLTAQHHGFAQQAYLQHGAYATSIVVGPGLDTENIIFRLVPDASISGHITNESNDAVRDSRVLLFS